MPRGTGPMWRKSTFSGAPDQNCVEIAVTANGSVAVRDSKDPSGPVLLFSPSEWQAFIVGAHAGEFDLSA